MNVPVLVRVPATDKVELLTIVPALAMLPLTDNVPFIVRVAPELIVIDLITFEAPATPITGWVPPAGMMTSVPTPGTALPHQLRATFQSEEIPEFPSQVPAAQLDPEIVTVPVEAPK